jgi:hypothetical protein
MSRVASRSSIDHLELNPSAFANKLPTYLPAKQSNRRGESSVGQVLGASALHLGHWKNREGRNQMLFRHCGSRSPRPGSCHWRVVAGYNEGTKTRVWIVRCGRLNCNKRVA